MIYKRYVLRCDMCVIEQVDALDRSSLKATAKALGWRLTWSWSFGRIGTCPRCLASAAGDPQPRSGGA